LLPALILYKQTWLLLRTDARRTVCHHYHAPINFSTILFQSRSVSRHSRFSCKPAFSLSCCYCYVDNVIRVDSGEHGKFSPKFGSEMTPMSMPISLPRQS